MMLPSLRLLVFGLLVLAICVPAAGQDGADARVKPMFNTLRLREAPSVASAVIAELTAGTPLALLGRDPGGGWLKVATADGLAGWVSAGYVEVFVSLAGVPVLDERHTTAAPVQTQTAAGPSAAGGAYVRSGVTALRLRQEPSTSAAILAELRGDTPLEILDQTADDAWLNVVALGQTGWVAAAYVARGTSARNAAAPATANLRGIRSIYEHGQALGNHPGVFTKIGDSITVSEYALDAIGRDMVNLGSYGHLQFVIDRFTGSGFNSFTHVSMAAGSGWTTAYVLEPLCNGVSVVECELDATKPSIALIQLGTNDLLYLSPDQFGFNLARIVDICIEKGVVPVLATIPYREGYESGVNTFNEIIRGIATSRDIPIWDVKHALDGLPNRGLSGDGVHPSWPPAGYADSANFANPEALQAGHVARNLKALEVLAHVLGVIGG